MKLDEFKKGFSKNAVWQAVVTCNIALSLYDTHPSQLLCACAAQPQAEAFLTAVIHRNHKYTIHIDTHIDTYTHQCLLHATA